MFVLVHTLLLGNFIVIGLVVRERQKFSFPGSHRDPRLIIKKKKVISYGVRKATTTLNFLQLLSSNVDFIPIKHYFDKSVCSETTNAKSSRAQLTELQEYPATPIITTRASNLNFTGTSPLT